MNRLSVIIHCKTVSRQDPIWADSLKTLVVTIIRIPGSLLNNQYNGQYQSFFFFSFVAQVIPNLFQQILLGGCERTAIHDPSLNI